MKSIRAAAGMRKRARFSSSPALTGVLPELRADMADIDTSGEVCAGADGTRAYFTLESQEGWPRIQRVVEAHLLTEGGVPQKADPNIVVYEAKGVPIFSEPEKRIFRNGLSLYEKRSKKKGNDLP